MKDTLTPAELKALPHVAIMVRRRKFRLEVYRRQGREYGRIFACKIAIGMEQFQTPTGIFFVIAKAKNPDWLMPDSPWVPVRDRGRLVKGGDPSNPIRGAFLRLTNDGVGIHGTLDRPSLGKRASHGCVRVTPQHARLLYHSIPVGSTVVIV